MKKVLITGSSGFIGHHVVQYLLANTDFELVLLERLGHSGNLNRFMEIPQFRETTRTKVLWHDLRSPVNDFLRGSIGEVDYIVHLAASTHVDRAIASPMEFVYDNVVATGNLLEFARGQKNLSLFLNFSTDEVYGPAPDGVYFKEGSPHLPSNPYSATKAGAVDLAYSYFVTYGLPVINTFTMNNFGERQSPDKFVPKTIRSAKLGLPMPLYATVVDGKIVEAGQRVWMYTENTADAVLFLLLKGVAGEGYNIIGADEMDIVTLANKIAAIVGRPLIPEYVGFYGARPGHDRRYALSGEKMMAMGWMPKYTLEESLEKVVQFTLENPQWM